jgi:probable F420-dependent oxidoreductase
MPSTQLKIGLAIEFRNEDPARSFHDVYLEQLDAVEWAEGAGFDYIWFGEHHFSPTGYVPAPLLFATAIALRTRRIRICNAVLLLPLYQPARLAEEGAVVDVLSDGRFELGVGLGWREQEYEALGVSMAGRGERADEALEVIHRLWGGDNVTFEGEHFSMHDITLSPRPVQHPRPRIWIGGLTAAAARRAARYGDGLAVTGGTARLDAIYRAELEKQNKNPDEGLMWNSFRWFFVSETPEATFRQVAPYVADWVNYYVDWGITAWPRVTRLEELHDPVHHFRVLSPQQAVDYISEYLAAVPCHGITINLQPPRYPIERAKEHAALFLDKVVPHLR